MSEADILRELTALGYALHGPQIESVKTLNQQRFTALAVELATLKVKKALPRISKARAAQASFLPVVRLDALYPGGLFPSAPSAVK